MDIEKGGVTSPSGQPLVGALPLHTPPQGSGGPAVSARSSTSSYRADSELGRLTQNYERALAALSDPATDSTPVTADVPIYYRPGTAAGGEGTGVPTERSHAVVATAAAPALLLRSDAEEHPELAELQRRYQHQEEEQVTDVPALLLRRPAGPRMQSDDRGTTYSVPMTNITSSEYADRDAYRPPSWNGALPCVSVSVSCAERRS